MALGLMVAGCASTSGRTTLNCQTDPGDPLEGWNRQIFAMNENFDHAVQLTAELVYVAVAAEPARNGVHNVLSNLNSPVIFANDLPPGGIGPCGPDRGPLRSQFNCGAGRAGQSTWRHPQGSPNTPRISAKRWASGGWATTRIWWCRSSGRPIHATLLGDAADTFADPLNYVGIRDYTYWAIARGVA